MRADLLKRFLSVPRPDTRMLYGGLRHVLGEARAGLQVAWHVACSDTMRISILLRRRHHFAFMQSLVKSVPSHSLYKSFAFEVTMQHS